MLKYTKNHAKHQTQTDIHQGPNINVCGIPDPGLAWYKLPAKDDGGRLKGKKPPTKVARVKLILNTLVTHLIVEISKWSPRPPNQTKHYLPS